MEITIRDLISIFLKRIWIIILCAVLCAGLGFCAAEFVIPPTYVTNVSMLVNSKNLSQSEQNNVNTINYNEKIASTFIEILKTNDFNEKISKDMGGIYTASQLKDMISIATVKSTQIFKISVSSDSPDVSFKIANEIITLAPEHIMSIYPADSVSVVESPVVPLSPASPSKRNFTVIGFILGFLVSFIISLLVELLDTRIKSEEDLTVNFDVPILGSIPKINFTKKDGGRNE